jgi:hypothetical protein
MATKMNLDFNFWCGYISKLGEMLGLNTQIIRLMDEPCPKGDEALILPHYDKPFADLYLAEDWEQHSPRDQRRTLIHEMLHCWQIPMRNLVACEGRKYLPGVAGRMFGDIYNREEERYCEGLAYAICELFPLPQKEVRPAETV